MKKSIIFTMLITMVICLCACSKKSSDNVPPQTESKSESESQTESATKDSLRETDSEETIIETSASGTENKAVSNESLANRMRELVDGNLYTIYHITGFSYLPHEESTFNEYYHKVTSEQFQTVNDIRYYLSTIYTQDATSVIMAELEPLYTDIDGSLYVNAMYMGGKGYYVDWENYSVTVTYSDESVCKFTVTASLEEPGDTPQITPYILEITAINENGIWLLDQMFS